MHSVDLAVLFPYLKEIYLSGGERLLEPGDPVDSVYFPSSSAISIVTVLSDGREIATESIGNESVAGLMPAITHIPPTTRMFVQISGGAISLPADRFSDRANESPALMALIHRFAQAQAAQAEQSAACHALHHLSARLARWLLICEDRVNGPRMLLTQDDLGAMAGALRSSVSLVASEFKEQGLINYNRGRVEILDRPGLERRACECYLLDRARREMLSAPPDPPPTG